MHKIYSLLWKFSDGVHKKIRIKSTSIFILANIILWSVVGLVLYLLVTLLPQVEFSVIYLLVVTGYSCCIMGFFGAAMYVFRNIDSDDLL